MTYDPENSKEQPTLPADLILDAVVVDIADGKVKEFVTENLDKWGLKSESQAINVSFEAQHEGTQFSFQKIFLYKEEEGKTVYSEKSHLGKYHLKYGALPKVGQKVKAISDSDGFLNLRLE